MLYIYIYIYISGVLCSLPVEIGHLRKLEKFLLQKNLLEELPNVRNDIVCMVSRGYLQYVSYYSDYWTLLFSHCVGCIV